jgi:hypothetical protein
MNHCCQKFAERPALPTDFHLTHDLAGEALQRLLVGGGDRLPCLGDEVGRLADV